MKKKVNYDLAAIMRKAWFLVKKCGFAMSEALKQSWQLAKLKLQMLDGIVKFHYLKVDGSIREAFGTLRADLLPATKGSDRRPNESLQVYFDTLKQEYRCFKIANLLDY